MKSVYLLLLCFTNSLGCRSKSNKKFPKYFTSDSWGGWYPEGNSWKAWIQKYGRENHSVAFDSTEVDRDVESGWPRYWKGMGKGNAGVPPPSWAYVPENYGRASYCYMLPDPGIPTPDKLPGVQEPTSRWGFNPKKNDCERFMYNGYGGNENNFRNKHACVESCGRVPSTGCSSGNIDFRDYIETKVPDIKKKKPNFYISSEYQTNYTMDDLYKKIIYS